MGDSEEENKNLNTVTEYCYEINKGEKMYLPMGFKHSYKNLGDTNVEAIIEISPDF